MTASAPLLALMIVNSGTRWLPDPETFGSKAGAGVPPYGPQLATSRNPSVGVQMVSAPYRRVELIGRLNLLRTKGSHDPLADNWD